MSSNFTISTLNNMTVLANKNVKGSIDADSIIINRLILLYFSCVRVINVLMFI